MEVGRVSTSIVRGITLFIAGALIASACGQAQQPVASAPATAGAATSAAPAAAEPIGPISVRLLGNWTTLDVQGQAESSGSTIAYAAYDRLVARDADGKIIPYLASSWEASASKVTFKLRTDATCADGTPVTPTVAANSFKRLFDPKTPSFNRPRIFGPGPYTVAADDAASTLTVGVATPFGDLLDAFAHYASSIICPAGLTDPAKLQDQMFGSGPYVMTESVRGDHVTLKRRDSWKWGPKGTTAADLPEQITIKVVTNDTTAANLLLTGGLDVGRVDGPDITRLLNEKSLTVNESHGFQSFPLVFQHKDGHPTADERVREALMSVIDPKAWAQAAFQKTIVTAALSTPDVRCADPSVSKYLPQQSTDRALSLLKDAGWTMQGGKLTKDGQQMTITIISSQTFYQRAAPEYIQSQFSKLGINAVVKDTDQPTFLTALRSANFDVVVVAATGAPPIISYATGSMSGSPPPPAGDGSNYGFIQDPQLEDAITKATASTDCATWNEVSRILLTKHHAEPIAAPVWFTFTKGLTLITTGQYPEFWSIRKKK